MTRKELHYILASEMRLGCQITGPFMLGKTIFVQCFVRLIMAFVCLMQVRVVWGLYGYFHVCV